MTLAREIKTLTRHNTKYSDECVNKCLWYVTLYVHTNNLYSNDDDTLFICNKVLQMERVVANYSNFKVFNVA